MNLFRRLTRHSRRRTLWLTALVVVVVVVAAVPALAQTSNEPRNLVEATGNALGNAIFLILSFVVWAMTKLFAVLTSVFVQMLVIVARYNVFLNAPVVQSGWPIVRDLMNMVFIIALLIIAAGTVLRLQNYRYNRLLGKLIIMAILVNFSKFIAVFLLQFAQVVMLTFVNAFRDIAFANFSHSFGLDQVLAFTASSSIFNNNGSFSVFLSLLAGLIMMIVAFVVMLSMTVMLFVRIIALWLLIIMSPVAYALRVLPNTERYAAQWWSEFTKYAVLGPVLAFFLWVSLALANATPSSNTGVSENPLRADPAVVTAIGQSTSSSGTLWYDFVTPLLGLDKMMSFIVAIIFLMLGMQYAQKSGAAGAAFAGKVAQTGFGAAAAVTGLNAIRDRTIAPVQGWIKNRQSARQAAIQERTMGLEAVGDRAKARLGVTQAQRERGAAAAAAFERQKVARQAQRQGYANLSREELLDHMLNNRDQSKRMAALTELQGRGMVDLGDEHQNQAFEDITRNTRMPEADKRKLREQILDSNVRSADEDTLRASAAGDSDQPEDKDRRIRAIQELDRRQILKANNEGDRNLMTQLRADLEGSPERVRQYRESMMKNNPDMAMALLMGNLQTTEGVQAYKDALQQRQISTATMTKDRYNALVKNPDGTDNVAGIATADAIVKHIQDISPDEETLRSYWKNMDPEASRLWGRHIDMKSEGNADRRYTVAKVTGEWDRAYQGTDGKQLKKLDAAGNVQLDDDGREIFLAQENFDRLGGAELSKSMSNGAIEQAEIQELMRRSGNFRFKDYETLRTRSNESRDSLTKGLENLARDIQGKGEGEAIDAIRLDGDEDSEEYKRKSAVAQHLFLASKAKINPYDLTHEGTRDTFKRTIYGASATDLSSMNKWIDENPEWSGYVHRELGINASLGELHDLLLINPKLAKEAIKLGEQELLDRIVAGMADDATAEQRGEGVRAENRLRSMAKDNAIGQHISYSPYGGPITGAKGARRRDGGDTGGTPPEGGGPATPKPGPGSPPNTPTKPGGTKKTPKTPAPARPVPPVTPPPEPEPETSAPAEPEGPAREELRDTLIDERGIERLERTKDKLREYEDLGGPDAFYGSSEYRNNRDQYLTTDQVRRLEVHPLGGVAAFGRSANPSNTIGYDSRVGGFEEFANAGEYITDPARKQAFAAKYVSLIDTQLDRLRQKKADDRTVGEQTYIDRLLRTKERLSDPDALENLQIINNGRLGYSDRHVVAHERTHAKLNAIDADGSFRKELKSSMAPEALQDVLQAVRVKMNDAELSDAEAFDEYLTEGIVNAKKSWADTSDDALHLDSAMLDRIQQQAIKAGGANNAFAVSLPTPEPAAPTPRSRENLMFKAMRVNAEREAARFRAAEEARQAREAAAKAAEAQAEEQADQAEAETEEREAGRARAVKGIQRPGQRTQAGLGRRVIDTVGGVAAGIRQGVSDRIAQAQMEAVAKQQAKYEAIKGGLAEKKAKSDAAAAEVTAAQQREAELRAEIVKVHDLAEAAATAGRVQEVGQHLDREEALTGELKKASTDREEKESAAQFYAGDYQRAVDSGMRQRRNVQRGKEKLGIGKPPTPPTAPTEPTPPPAAPSSPSAGQLRAEIAQAQIDDLEKYGKPRDERLSDINAQLSKPDPRRSAFEERALREEGRKLAQEVKQMEAATKRLRDAESGAGTTPPAPAPASRPKPKSASTPPPTPTPPPAAPEPAAATPSTPTRPGRAARPSTGPAVNATPSGGQNGDGISSALSQLGRARSQDMEALRQSFDAAVKSLETANHANADVLRKGLERLPRSEGTGGDLTESKRMFREFGEELLRQVRKNGPSNPPKAPTGPKPPAPTKTPKPS